MDRIIKRGDIYYANLNPVIGSEQGGTRPVLIISNDTGNKHSPTVIVAAITGQIGTKKKLPTHTIVHNVNGLDKDSIITRIGMWLQNILMRVSQEHRQRNDQIS